MANLLVAIGTLIAISSSMKMLEQEAGIIGDRGSLSSKDDAGEQVAEVSAETSSSVAVSVMRSAS